MLVVSTIGGRICGQRAPSRSAAPWKIVLAVCLACLLLTCGCRTSSKQYVQNGYKVGPNYCTPEAEVASGWIDYQDSRVNSNEPVAGDWWQVFNDPGLNTLMKLAKEQNLTLQEASFRILEARNRRDIVAGNLLPQTQTMGGGVRNQQLSLAAGYPSGGAGGLPAGTDRQFNVWSSGPLLAWELDFWGRFRRAVESADADLGAAVSNFDNVLVILYSDVASTYLQIRIAEQRLKYAKANVEIQKRSLEMAETRKEHGKASNLDIAQGVSNLSATEAIVPELESQLRQGENRLCVLLGRAPTDIRSLVEETVEIPKVAPQIALGIPAELLRRRPDVRQAERELAAQSARIGIAETELYPALRINGAVFVQANQFTNLFAANALAGNVGPSFSWNIFNYGRLKKGVDMEEAKYMEKAAHYQSTVLNANREAEDALVAFLKAQDRARVLRKGVSAAILSSKLTNDLYQAGKADFGRVFFAEYFLVLQQDELAQAEGAIALRLIDLYRALGGGWQADPAEYVTSPAPFVAPQPEVLAPEPSQPAEAKSESKSRGVPAKSVAMTPTKNQRLPGVVLKAVPVEGASAVGSPAHVESAVSKPAILAVGTSPRNVTGKPTAAESKSSTPRQPTSELTRLPSGSSNGLRPLLFPVPKSNTENARSPRKQPSQQVRSKSEW